MDTSTDTFRQHLKNIETGTAIIVPSRNATEEEKIEIVAARILRHLEQIGGGLGVGLLRNSVTNHRTRHRFEPAMGVLLERGEIALKPGRSHGARAILTTPTATHPE